jgi:AsmA protein
MDRREPPSLTLPPPRTVRPAPADEPPPRLRPLREATPRRRSWLARLGVVALYGALALACVVAAVATFLLIAAPTDLAREQIVVQIKARTGRTLEIKGPAAFTLYPHVGFSLSDVVLSAPPGMQAAPLLIAKRLSAEVRLMPLMKREVVVRRLVIADPVIELTIDAEGRRSWDFAAADVPQGPVRVAQAGSRGTKSDALPAELKDFVRNASDPAKAGETALATRGLEELALADTRFENGTLRYRDLRAGRLHEARAIHAQFSMRALASPLDIKGTFEWQGESMALDARLTALKSVLEGRPATLVAALSGRPLQASYEGALVQRGTELPPAAGAGPGALTGMLKVSGTSTTLDALVATLDGNSANGSVAIETGGVRPLVKANLRMAELSLDKLSTGASQVSPSPQAPPTRRPEPSPPAPKDATQPQSIEDLLARDAPGPQVRGFLVRDGWSGDPLTLAALREVDVEARLSLGKITSGRLQVASTRLAAILKGGQLRLDVEDTQLYEGRGRGFLTLDATKAAATLAANLQLEGVAAQSLLKDAAGFDSLAGKGRVSLAVAGQGASEKEIVETLAGRADLTVADGAIVGWNIPGMIRGLSQGRFSGFDRQPGERTDFSELAASFQIASGIATTKDLRLTSPALRVAGAGQVELPARRLDLTLRPRLAGLGDADLSAFEVPIRVQGPWDRPSYAPDLKDVLRDPDKAIDAARKLGKQLDPDGKLGSIIRGLLGR